MESKVLLKFLKKHLGTIGTDWTEFIHTAMLTYNTYSTPNLDGLSPFELTFGRKAKITPNIELNPDAPISVPFHKYLTELQNKPKYLRQHVQKF